MAEQTEAVAPSFDQKMDRLFGETEEAPTQDEPEAVEAAEETQEPDPTGDEALPAETSEATEEVIEVEFNGTKYQVPPELKDVLMKSSDYTQKTQSVAQQKRELDLQQQQIAVAREEVAFQQSISQELDTLKMLEQYIPYLKANTNWDSLTTDQFVRKQKELSDLADQHRELSAAIQGKHNEFKAKVEGERQKLKKQATEVLSKAIPGWNDAVRGEVESYIKTLGYPEVAIPNMSSLDYQVAWKAAQYDKIKSGTATAVKKASEAPMIKATSRNEMPSKVKEMLAAKKAIKKSPKGSPEHKAALDRRLSQIFGG